MKKGPMTGIKVLEVANWVAGPSLHITKNQSNCPGKEKTLSEVLTKYKKLV